MLWLLWLWCLKKAAGFFSVPPAPSGNISMIFIPDTGKAARTLLLWRRTKPMIAAFLSLFIFQVSLKPHDGVFDKSFFPGLNLLVQMEKARHRGIFV